MQRRWIKAIKQELSNLKHVNVWEDFDLPPGEHTLGITWVYNRKTEAIGALNRSKVRLRIKGFSQIEGLYYSKTYPPTGRLVTLCTSLSIDATKELGTIQMDAVGALLNGVPEEETLYIKLPKGYICKTKVKEHCATTK